MKLILEILEKAGITLPAWFFILLVIILIFVGAQTLWFRVLRPIVKKLFKVQDNIEDIDELKGKVSTIETKQASIDAKIDSLINSVSKLVAVSDVHAVNDKAQNEALKMMLANELDKRYRRYIDLGYVPVDEYDEYVDMFAVYSDPKGLNGNHGTKIKFNYIKDHLQIK